MNSSSLLFTVAIVIIYSIQNVHCQGIPMEAMKCMAPKTLQMSLVDCQKELYAALKEDPKKNCTKGVANMFPSCLNATVTGCLKKAFGDNYDNIMSSMQPGVMDISINALTSSAEFFCEKFAIVMLDPVKNCSDGYYISKGMCENTFGQKFNANYADPELCSDYSTQMSCVKDAIDTHCEAEQAKNFTMKYDFMFQDAGNPFCATDDNVVPDGAASLVGQSLIIALCLFIIKLIV